DGAGGAEEAEGEEEDGWWGEQGDGLFDAGGTVDPEEEEGVLVGFLAEEGDGVEGVFVEAEGEPGGGGGGVGDGGEGVDGGGGGWGRGAVGEEGGWVGHSLDGY